MPLVVSNNFEDNAAIIIDLFGSSYLAAFATAYPSSTLPTIKLDDNKYITKAGASSVRFFVRETESMSASCGAPGNRRWRVLGNAVMLIQSALSDPITARQYADIGAHIFRGLWIDNITFLAPKITVFGGEGYHNRAWLYSPFRYDFKE